MAGKIPREFIQELIARIDLVDVVDARVPLRQVGSNFTARCPFHNEKTPSFTVSRDKQFYHCFGCGAHGNVIDFLMGYDHLTFVEAVESLAALAGLKIPEEAQRAAAESGVKMANAIYELQDAVSRFYAHQLKVHPAAPRAVAYLKDRGVSGELAQRYRLGYAPPGWQNLPSEFSQELLNAAGLRVVKGDKVYDSFRDRIIFPIRDRRGRVVGFGGRVMGDGTPKYLNSPETIVFKKHREVYGLYELLKQSTRPERIVVVEGYMDVIALAQNGIRNAVATLGTATSADHVELLFRYTDELVFCFDGDSAGQKAAWKALEASLPSLRDGRQIRFLLLPEGHDPDSLVRTEGTEAFLKRLDAALPFSDYFFRSLVQRLDLDTLEGRATLVNEARPLIGRLPGGVFREMIESRLVELAGHGVVEPSDKSAKLVVPSESRVASASSGMRPSTSRLLLALLVQNPELAAMVGDDLRANLGAARKNGRLIQKVLQILNENPGLTSGGILEHFRGTPEEKLIATLMQWDVPLPPDGIRIEFSDALMRFEKQLKQERLDELIKKSKKFQLSSAEREEMRVLMSS
ncbi:DNA primase [Methylocaldum szegediense]|uniref:DNA primase n=1 Tax=Methylocaldum szegediense TaxID=73780 RepID=A0ABN8X8I9_9GAMM|nr:DNA primase [Methylocaldum szegediense]CAI8943657.1 DNA primase [Methylocaldum szegediense]